MSKDDKEYKPSIPILKSPLKEFADHNLLKFEPETDSNQLINAANSALIAENHNTISSELLSLQTELLIKSRNTDPSYENLILRSTPIYNKDGIRIDCYDSNSQSISICPNNTKLKLGEVLIHEMTHAIDDLYDNRKSGNSILTALKFKNNGLITNSDFQKNAIKLVSETLSPEIQTSLRVSYITPAIQGHTEFTTICESAERKTKENYPSPARLTKQEKAASVLLGEFTAFTFETLFSELQQDPTAPSKFLENYKRLNPTPSVAIASERSSARLASRSPDLSGVNEEQEIKNTAQEVIAVSIFEITKHMIHHIESDFAKTSPSAETKASVSTPDETVVDHRLRARSTLLVRLQEVHSAITPAYERAQEKISRYTIPPNDIIDSIATAADKEENNKKRKEAPRIHTLNAEDLVAGMRQRSNSISGTSLRQSSPNIIRKLSSSKSESSLQR